MPTRINRSDVQDLDFLDAAELAAYGAAAFRTGDAVATVTGATKTIVGAGAAWLRGDDPVEPGDTVVLSGNAAAGSYTVATVADDVTLTVTETIVDATGGAAAFFYPSGGSRVGLNSTGLPGLTASNMQSGFAQHVGAGGVAHSVATPDPGGAAGFMSPEDKASLDGIISSGAASAQLGLPIEMVYTNAVGVTTNLVVCTRVYLPEGTYSHMRMALTLGSAAGRNIDAGVYSDSGTGPRSYSPDQKLTSTGATVTTTGGADPHFFRVALTSNLVVPAGGGFYWLAFACNSSTPQVLSSVVQNAIMSGRLFAKKTAGASSGVLPATLSGMDAAGTMALPYLYIEKAS